MLYNSVLYNKVRNSKLYGVDATIIIFVFLFVVIRFDDVEKYIFYKFHWRYERQRIYDRKQVCTAVLSARFFKSILIIENLSLTF